MMWYVGYLRWRTKSCETLDANAIQLVEHNDIEQEVLLWELLFYMSMRLQITVNFVSDPTINAKSLSKKLFSNKLT